MKPLIVYISGSPGSGKSTLANALSEQLYIPRVSCDLIQGGVRLSGSTASREEILLKVFIPTMTDMAQRGVSFVVDHLLYRGLSETDIIDRLRPDATIIYIHTQSANAIERYISRIETSTVPDVVARRQYLLERAEHHRDNFEDTSEPLDLGIPTLVVNTDNGYAPSLEEIVEFIQRTHQSNSL